MTIASEIQRIQTNIANAYDAAEAKGATMPATENSDNLATTITSISGGSGDTVSAKNYTGSTITAGSKVWINNYHYTADSTDAISIGTYNSISNSTRVFYTPDGQHFIAAQGKYYTRDGVLLGTSSYYTSNMAVSPVIYYTDGIMYVQNNTGMQRIDSGLGWSHAGWKPLHGDPSFVYDYTNTQIHKINPIDGTIIKTFTVADNKFNNFKSYQFSGIAYNDNTLILPYANSAPTTDNNRTDYPSYTILLDYENNTATTGVDLNCNRLTTSYGTGDYSGGGWFPTMGVTSDRKYAITTSGYYGYAGHIYDISNLNNIKDIMNVNKFGAITLIGAAKFYPIANSNILTYTGASAGGTYSPGNMDTVSAGTCKTFQYDIISGEWNLIPLDYHTLMPSTGSPRWDYFNGVSYDLQSIYFNNTGGNVSGVAYPFYTIHMNSQVGYSLVNHYGGLVSIDTLTGYTDGDITAGSSEDIRTALPYKIDVSVTIDTDDATITLEQ